MKYTIIITGYNAGQYVDACMQSVIKQDYDMNEVEIIAIDDCSTDDTWDRLTGYQGEHLTLIRNEINMGAAFGRWHAGQIATGEIVCYLGMDDMLKRSCLKTLDRYYTDPNTRMTYGSWCYETGKPRIAESYPNQVIKERSYRRNKWRATALQTFKKELVDQVPIECLKDKEGKWLTNCTDLAVGFPCLEMCDIHEIRVVKEIVYIYRHDHSGTTLNRLGKQHKTRIREYLKTIPKQPKRGI